MLINISWKGGVHRNSFPAEKSMLGGEMVDPISVAGWNEAR